MSQFKNNPKYTLFYTDTDSIIIDKPLESKFIGDYLGLFKLEYKIEKGVFLKFTHLQHQMVKKLLKLKVLIINTWIELMYETFKNYYGRKYTQEKWFKKLVILPSCISLLLINDLYR